MSPSESALDAVHNGLRESARVKEALVEQAPQVVALAEQITGVFQQGGRLYACGNGGSACDAMHLVEELVARYKRDRPGLPAHHLLDAALLTCWSNDYSYESAFRRQVETLARPGDVLVAISTSGNSPNIIEAVRAAREQGVRTIGLTGRDGGAMAELCDVVLIVPSDATERIQEGHITIIHLLCELIERMVFFDLAVEPSGS